MTTSAVGGAVISFDSARAGAAPVIPMVGQCEKAPGGLPRLGRKIARLAPWTLEGKF